MKICQEILDPFEDVKLPVLPHGVSSQLRRNPPKHTLLRSFGASKGTLFAFIPVLPDGAFCEGG